MIRIGLGYDVHRLVNGRKLILGGVNIPYNKGLLGHSDADVLLHSIIDALLGSLALGDIGKLFTDKDPKYKDIDSSILLQSAYKLLKDKGAILINLDSIIIAEKPKLAPHIPQMRENIAKYLEVPTDIISIKATTSEGLGPEGRGESISAHAVVLIEKV